MIFCLFVFVHRRFIRVHNWFILTGLDLQKTATPKEVAAIKPSPSADKLAGTIPTKLDVLTKRVNLIDSKIESIEDSNKNIEAMHSVKNGRNPKF